MQTLKEELSRRLSTLEIEDPLRERLDMLISEILEKCVSFFTEKEAKAVLDERGVLVDADDMFCNWFSKEKSEIAGEIFYDLFDPVYKDVLNSLFLQIKKRGSAKVKGVYLNGGSARLFVDIGAEAFEIGSNRYILISLKNREFDHTNYKLSKIEKEVADLIIRVKDFVPLMRELMQIFVDSGLFQFAWTGKIDTRVSRVIPLVSCGIGNESEKIENTLMDFSFFREVLDVMVGKRELVADTGSFKEFGFRKRIIFPIFKKWEYDSCEDVAYVVLVYSKERLELSAEEMNRIKEVIYKINLAATDIFLREQVSEIASVDVLTSLPNRERFLKRIDQLISEETPFAAVMLDIDRLRKVNDVLGFWAGDEVIKNLADFLKEVLKEEFVARVGTDEFGLIIKGDKLRIYSLLDEIISYNEKFVQIQSSSLYVPFSSGVVFFPEDGKTKEELVLKLENALEEAKKRGGKALQYANRSISFLPKDYLELERELKEAIKKREYILHYQPIVDLKGKKVWGVEALIRWESQKRGLVPPAKFMDILEESGLINEVGDIVIDEVCKVAKEFEGFDINVAFSMNISVIQLMNENIASKIIETAQNYGVDTGKIVVEITESVLMENLEYLKDQIEQMVQSGIQIEIDDFGTGYSSLSYLKRLPISSLKIDREFIKDIISDEEDRSIVSAIISMASALNKKSIAEGVESADQLKLLQKMGIDLIQGFYFAKPMPKKELKRYLENFSLERFL